jgi:hypothetical protein
VTPASRSHREFQKIKQNLLEFIAEAVRNFKEAGDRRLKSKWLTSEALTELLNDRYEFTGDLKLDSKRLNRVIGKFVGIDSENGCDG